MREVVVLCGSAHRPLASSICEHLGVPLSVAEIKRFSNDCLYVQLQENCRQRDVYVIQPLVAPTQEHLMELLLMLDAARGASVAQVTAVVPHYAYARSDKKDASRISIAGRLVADMITTAGANRVLTMTLHAPQVHGFFSVPVDHLTAIGELAEHFRGRDLSNTVVVSPDLGNAKSAAAFARRLGVPVAAGAKERLSDTEVRMSMLIGDVRGRDAIVLDDEIVSGGSIVELIRHLREHKARSLRIACTHGIFSGSAIARLAAEPDILEIVCTNTVPIPEKKRVPKLTVLSIAPALAEAMRRINSGASVSALFDTDVANAEEATGTDRPRDASSS
jgi:ribose-phosphate pyrophosphokinase